MTPLAAWLLVLALQQSGSRTLDAFSNVTEWSAHPADGVDLLIRSGTGYRGPGMRLDFAFRGGAGYAVARKRFPLDLPDDYQFTFYIRGTAPSNNLEFKLIDSTGDNVWWVNRRGFTFPRVWTKVTIKKRDVRFAWGPVGGGELRRLAAIEIAITAGSGGTGSVWIDELALSPRAPAPGPAAAPVARASSAADGAPPNAALDGTPATAWHSGSGERQWFTLDFGATHEYGGIIVDWHAHDFARDYDVERSADGRRWEVMERVRGAVGERTHHYLPERESRYLRLTLLRSARQQGYGIAELSIQPLEFSASANAFVAAVARDAAPGSYPRYFSNRQSYWTVAGVSGGMQEALLNDDGMLEPGPRQFSLEPFLWTQGRLITWHDVERTPSLLNDYLPIPSVAWRAGDLRLTVTAIAAGRPDAPTVYAHYRVTNAGITPARGQLFLGIRPFEVNPPWQNLNTSGGVTAIQQLTYDGRIVTVNGGATVVPLSTPAGFGAARFTQGGIIAALRRGELPPARAIADGSGWASGALAYPFDLAPGGERDIAIAIPMQSRASLPAPNQSDSAVTHLIADTRRAAAGAWEAEVNRVTFALPPAADRFLHTLKSTLAYILVNRRGPAIRPGPRAYARSWIRDGALISEALLRLGHAREVREFAEWYASHQYAGGKIPCCVDARGADPVPEHDSHGEFIYLVTEYYRVTRDTAFLRRLWPRIASAAAYIDSLRGERRTPEYREPARREFYGLLPPSISHEGYSAQPMHSYWDDFWALRGVADASFAAAALGDPGAAVRWASVRDELRADILASLAAAMARHRIDYLPGAADLGDFDPPSTAVAIAPGGELAHLPPQAVQRTFDRYYEAFVARRDGTIPWDGYAPYELRVGGVFLRLGQPERARALLDYFLGDRRPAAWNQWPEVVWRDPDAPKFLGDLPHTWIGAEFLRSVLDLFAYQRERDSSLVVAAGLPVEWISAPSGVAVRGLVTHYGNLGLTVQASGNTARVRVDGTLAVPPGGVVVGSPLPRTIRSITVNGETAHPSPAGEIIVRVLPADVVFGY